LNAIAKLLGLSLIVSTGFLISTGTTDNVRPPETKPRTRPVTIGFHKGPRVDSDPTLVDVVASANVVLSPDGTRAMPRDGQVERKHYNIQHADALTTGRKVIIIDQKPPDIDQMMHMIVNPSTGSVDAIGFSRDTLSAPNEDAAFATLGIISDSIQPELLIVASVYIVRTGNLDISTTISARCIYTDIPGMTPEDVDASPIGLSLQNMELVAGATEVGSTAVLPETDIDETYEITWAIEVADGSNVIVDPDRASTTLRFTRVAP
jgi:hypothetical protein